MKKSLFVTLCLLFGNLVNAYDLKFNEKKDTLISFLNSKEFKLIKRDISPLKYNSIENAWLLGIDEGLNPKFSDKSYSWSDGDSYHQILFWEKLVVISYHLTVGINTGTLIYNRNSKTFKTFSFHTDEIQGKYLNISKEGYDKNGHWWQSGKMDLLNFSIKWNNLLDR